MSANRSSIGVCPFCGAEIPSANVIIEYETEGGTAHFAECPGCHDVARPERNDA